MTLEQVISLSCGSKFTIHGQHGTVIAYVRNSGPMHDAIDVLLDGAKTRYTRSDFLADSFVFISSEPCG
jgi:hypothetical protein